MNLPQVIKTAPVKTPTLLYPALIVAAISVTLFSLIGIAGMTGHLPTATAAGDEAPKAELHRMAAPCNECGVIESVQAVTRKGEASGVGAVAGGVLGAVVGNQVGKGNGRKAMTVLGAVGGGVAGNEIEKRSKSTTVHVVKVRMDDGSLRSIEQAASAHVGERVVVEGNKLRALPAQQG